MFQIKDKIENAAENIEGLVKDYYTLGVVNIVDKGSKLGSLFIVTLLLGALGFFTFLFAGIGIAHWIGEALHNVMYGYFIVATFLLLVFILIIVFSKKLIVPFLRNIIIKNIYD
jgi:hypothetical protein